MELESRDSAVRAAEARSILIAAAEAQTSARTSVESWLGMPGVRVNVHDEWHGWITAAMSSWPENPQSMRFDFVPGADDGVVYFLDESGAPNGRVWGIHDWNTWIQTDAEAPRYVESELLTFALPTQQYFLEMAFRLAQSAGQSAIVDYAGETEWEGDAYDVVYITWDSYSPHDMMDQYVAWVEKESGLLTRVDFTVRDSAPFVTASAFYRDFRENSGYLVPHQIDITGLGAPDEVLHDFSVASWELNYELPREAYAPEPGRAPGSKYE